MGLAQKKNSILFFVSSTLIVNLTFPYQRVLKNSMWQDFQIVVLGNLTIFFAPKYFVFRLASN